ncbi:L-piperidine-6-carboxylate dehydrogenase [Bythopirellula polymerisocia]|uniref:Succinate-semialdehyde dehydrogenase [NADP(+)] n=1 Tax=Bythopirellula polymerisocia TaxID=2528003 RepID=A0A5C6CVU4_9BACT|nr:aldehyde dehydrogenase family protein [Bythopirellula polymerisocia]TWU28558.1 Succinate-semialdehyde dehydrogenase [NADP(+)] [Bythopirellula polymerisocia]
MNAHLQKACQQLGLPNDHLAISIGSNWQPGRGESLNVRSPIDGQTLAEFKMADARQVEAVVKEATAAFVKWRTVPAPVRGEFVRQYGEKLREFKQSLATLVSWEAGKITQEALGEVQEMIDICDFAVGLSRQLYGKTIASERPSHRLTEQWHPLGPIGVISAFNFPVAVWAWNAAIAWVCGDPVIWKPSEKTPLTAIACQTLFSQVLADNPEVPPAISSLIVGGADVGQSLATSPKLPLISATGSVPMGRAVAQNVAARLGRSLLELGGNNGMIVAPSADLDLAIRSITFSAVGTCGQRCTSLRRAIVHESIADKLRDQLLGVYEKLPIGDPTSDGTLVGPLVDERAFDSMESALAAAKSQGGIVHGGGRMTSNVPQGGFYVRPALVEIASDAPIIQQETFAPILYFMRYRSLDEAIGIHNCVPQGLASAILTNDVREAELFCSAAGSDCGIANVNIGTSGAEIGGAFGGEKETGGGRESGSDSWKLYMRRATNTINYSTDLPLAQGIRFEV